MISIQEAIELISSQSVERQKQSLSVMESLNYYLADTITAPLNLPSFDNSAMDGYAVLGEGPTYEIVGEIQAGDTRNHQLKPGQAFRIFTGARVPKDCQAVIMQEKTRVEHGNVITEDSPEPGKNIRYTGEQIKKGSEVFSTGQKINSSVIGLLSSFGMTDVSVFSKPDITLLTTGDELVPPGQTLKEGQLYESNSNTLRATLNQLGFSSGYHHIRDDFDSTRKAIAHHLDRSDVLLISGGISVGDYDFVKKALEENGVEEIFYRVFQKPGKPLFFGKKGSKFVFGLPGNPASSLVCLYVYVYPLLKKISGGPFEGLNSFELPLASSFSMKTDRPSFMKAKIEGNEVQILEGQGSSMLYTMATGNALALMNEGKNYQKGDKIKCWLTH
ncbi:MAG: molybdopterin molybdotransferase MoeA [Cyclobacteriaceae bacterium]|nr:molybdopterin molybdotransferase MoeA [Cyclobacteriaceae bacterium SS2]